MKRRIFNLFQRLEDSKKLPIGHIERIKAEKAVNAIYKQCSEQERLWHKQLPKSYRRNSYITDKKFTRRLVNYLCDSLGTVRVKALWWKSPDVSKYATAHYMRGEIHFKYGGAGLTTIIHETTHHIQRVEGFGLGHGDDFCMLERMLFPLAKEFLKEEKKC